MASNFLVGMDSDMDKPNNNVMKRLEEGRQLPWGSVPHGTMVKLANKLDPQSPVSNNDWKGLAEHLGFSTGDILVLESLKERSTLALFYNYMPKKNATVNKVAKALKQMNREDALEILLDAVPDIEAQFDNNPQNSTMEGVEGDDTCITAIPQGGCRCLGSPTSLHGAGGACSPCHPHNHHHHHPQVQCSLTSGSCCCHHMGMHAAHCHTPGPAPLAAFSSFNLPQTPLSLMSSNLGCGGVVSSAGGAGGVGGGASHLVSNNYNSHIESSNYPACGGGGGRDMYPRTTQALLVGAGRSSVCQHPLPGAQPRASPLQQHHYADLPVSSYSPVPDSLLVHHNAESRHRRGLDSFASSEGMELDHGGRRDEPALLHTTIARGEGLLSGGPMPMEVGSADPAGGDDTTPSTSLEELSSSDSAGSRLPLNVVARQESEECNAKQPFFAATSASSLSQSGAAKHDGTDGNNAAAWAAGGGSVGHRQALAGGPSQSSLKQLETLSNSLGSFKPGPKYTHMVAEQKVEESMSGVGGSQRRQIKRERGVGGDCTVKIMGGLPSSASSSDSSRSGGEGSRSGRDTFPMRVKPQVAGGSTVEQVRSRPPGMLTKTTSVPMDMKVEAFKKAFRHIKVFVTYANDGKQHRKQVLSLCNCLERNGFSCCVDVNPRLDTPNELQNSQDWSRRKFKEADFVLVCLSPLYLQEIQGVDNAGRHPNVVAKSSLHTAFIYRLMKEEHQATRLSSRFVPLHMEGSPCESPPWLTGHLTYRWPQQFKDLLWMLTKPEERIKQRSRSSPSKGHGKVNGLHTSSFLS